MRPDTFLAGKRHGLRDALSHGGHLAAELMYPGREVEHKRQTMRMRRRPCGGERLLALVERLVWIAQEPQDTGEIGEGCYPSILPIEGERLRAQMQCPGLMPYILITQIHAEGTALHLLRFHQRPFLVGTVSGDAGIPCCRPGLKLEHCTTRSIRKMTLRGP
jgi:hypothetical protein